MLLATTLTGGTPTSAPTVAPKHRSPSTIPIPAPIPASIPVPITAFRWHLATVTAYTAGPASTGKQPGDPGYGITFSGAAQGIIQANMPQMGRLGVVSLAGFSVQDGSGQTKVVLRLDEAHNPLNDYVRIPVVLTAVGTAYPHGAG